LEEEQEEISSKLDCEAALRAKGWYILDKKQGDLLLLAGSHGLINVIKFLTSNKLSVKYTNDFGDGLLHFAAKGGNPKMVLYLLRRGLDPNVRNKFLETPLFHAAEGGNLDIVNIFSNYKCQFDLQDKFGDTALHFAAREGWVEICDYLIKQCPELLLMKNQEGKNALAYAIDNSQTSAGQVMKLHGWAAHYGERKAKIQELAQKLMEEPPNHKKSIFKQIPSKITLFGEKKGRDWLEEVRREQRGKAYAMKMEKEEKMQEAKRDPEDGVK